MLEKLCVRQKLKCINFHAQVREFRPNEVFFLTLYDYLVFRTVFPMVSCKSCFSFLLLLLRDIPARI